MSKIRILIVDDHPVLRAGLKMLFSSDAQLEIVAETGSGKEAVLLAERTTADIAVVDLTIPDLPGLKVIEQLKKKRPAVKAIVLTMHEEPAYVRSALAAGALGYVVKRVADHELISAIKKVHAGRVFVDRCLSEEILLELITKVHGVHKRTPAPVLSERERDVLRLIADGFSHREMAEKIHLSVKTIETYRSRIAMKLGLHTRAEIVHYAREAGFTSSL